MSERKRKSVVDYWAMLGKILAEAEQVAPC